MVEAYLLKSLLVGDLGALQQADDILGALDDGRLDPQPVPQLLHPLLQRRLQVALKLVYFKHNTD